MTPGITPYARCHVTEPMVNDAVHGDRQRIMVFVINEMRTGFIVDSVAEVLKISRSLIEQAPSLSSEQQRLFGRVANLPKHKRMIQLVEPRQLLADGELDALARVA